MVSTANCSQTTVVQKEVLETTTVENVENPASPIKHSLKSTQFIDPDCFKMGGKFNSIVTNIHQCCNGEALHTFFAIRSIPFKDFSIAFKDCFLIIFLN